jgi:hypothetical protein
MERLEAHRALFASLTTAQAGVPSGRLFFSCSGGAERSIQPSTISNQPKPREKSHVSWASICQDVLFLD